jgi:hypothetical protein
MVYIKFLKISFLSKIAQKKTFNISVKGFFKNLAKFYLPPKPVGLPTLVIAHLNPK